MRLAVVLALLGLLLASGALLAREAASGTASVDPCPPSAIGQSHGKLGTVIDTRSSAYVRNSSAPGDTVSSEFELYAGNYVCTDQSGRIQFKAKTGDTTATCTAGPDAHFSLGVQKKQLVLNFFSKHSYSVTSCDTHKVELVPPQHRTIKSSNGPVFVIEVAPKQSVITVAQGFLQIGPLASGGSSKIIGPNERTIITDTSTAIGPRQPLSPLASSLLRTFEAALPKPAYARPSSRKALTSSPTLARIGRNRRIVVGLGPELSDSQTRAFVKAYFGLLATQWHLTKRPPFELKYGIQSEVARTRLGQGRIDLYITKSPPPKTLAAPFFGDRSGSAWQFVVSADPVFLRSMTTFLQATLDSGEYDTLYRRSLAGQPPIYRVVAPLIFPAAPCTPRPDADLTSLLDLRLDLTSSPSGPVGPDAMVTQTATVTNTGKRIVDCVRLKIQVSGGLPLNDSALVKLGCTQTFPPGQNEVDLSCELGRLGLGEKKSRSVVVRPGASPTSPGSFNETCADADAVESGGLPEVPLADNSACAQLVYRPMRLPLMVGAADDRVQFPADPSAPSPVDRLDQAARIALVSQAGFGAAVATAHWRPGMTVASEGQVAELKRTVAAARAEGIEVILAVYNFDDRRPPKLTAATDTPVSSAEQDEFAAYAASLVRSVPGLAALIVGNEPNNGRFWSPQYGRGGSDVAASAYETLLAKTYDAVKAADSSVEVIGGALAPRGADSPKPGRKSHSPVTFLADLGTAYRVSKRPGPIMDAFALHPLPEGPSVPPTTQHPTPSTALGIADYQFLVSLLGRAFDTTGQAGSSLPIYYSEYAVTSAPRQADYYRQAIALASCQPTVKGIFIFHAFDQAPWPSGVYRSDGTPKASLPLVRVAALAAQARTVSSCPPLPRATG